MDALERRFIPWLDAVSELVRRPCNEFPHSLLLCLLGQTFDQPVGWNSVGRDGQFAVEFHGAAPDWPPADLMTDFTGHVRAHPLMQWHRATGDPAAMTIGRVPDEMVTRRGREVVHDFLEPYGYEEQLSLTCSAQPGRSGHSSWAAPAATSRTRTCRSPAGCSHSSPSSRGRPTSWPGVRATRVTAPTSPAASWRRCDCSTRA